MRLWRISDFADLSGVGGLMEEARWHSRGRRIVYVADHPASALLEVLVHLEVDLADLPEDYQLLVIDAPDDIPFERVEVADLPPNWQGNLASTQARGDDWLKEGKTALCCVPSAIVPFAENWLLNPLHADAARLRIARAIRVPYDPRLLT